MSDTTVDGGTPNPSENNSIRDQLPEWARKQISDANNEAAKYRVELRTKTDEHSQALSQITALTDEKAALTTRAEEAERSLLKIQIALDAGVPGDRVRSIAERLVGTNEAELKADAEKIVADFGLTNAPVRTPATDPNQGRTGGDAPLSNNPATLFAAQFKQQFEKQLSR